MDDSLILFSPWLQTIIEAPFPIMCVLLHVDGVDLLDGGKEHRWMGPNRHAKELLKAGKPGSRSSGIRVSNGE